jgi:hypothetical protein
MEVTWRPLEAKLALAQCVVFVFMGWLVEPLAAMGETLEIPYDDEALRPLG